MERSATPTSAGPLPEIDWAAEGIETELGWSLQAMYQGFGRAASEAVIPVPGGPRGYQVLVAITAEEPSSQLALAHRLGIDKTAMTYVIDALESGGFVQRRPDPSDRRVRQVIPTAAGRALLSSTRIALHTAEALLMRDLTSEEQMQLRRLLARVALGASDVESCLPAVDPTFELPIAAPRQQSRRRHDRQERLRPQIQ